LPILAPPIPASPSHAQPLVLAHPDEGSTSPLPAEQSALALHRYAMPRHAPPRLSRPRVKLVPRTLCGCLKSPVAPGGPLHRISR